MVLASKSPQNERRKREKQKREQGVSHDFQGVGGFHCTLVFGAPLCSYLGQGHGGGKIRVQFGRVGRRSFGGLSGSELL